MQTVFEFANRSLPTLVCRVKAALQDGGKLQAHGELDPVPWRMTAHTLTLIIKVSANPKLTVLHNFGFLYDSINLRNSFRLKKKTPKNAIRAESYLAKTIFPS